MHNVKGSDSGFYFQCHAEYLGGKEVQFYHFVCVPYAFVGCGFVFAIVARYETLLVVYWRQFLEHSTVSLKRFCYSGEMKDGCWY